MGNVVTVTVSDDACAIRPNRKNAHRYFMGTVALKTVTVTRDGVSGEWLYEFEEIRELGREALAMLTRLVDTGRGLVKATDWEAYVEALDTYLESDEDMAEPTFPETVTGNTYRAAYVCGSDFYVG